MQHYWKVGLEMAFNRGVVHAIEAVCHYAVINMNEIEVYYVMTKKMSWHNIEENVTKEMGLWS